MYEWRESPRSNLPISTDDRVQHWTIGMRLSMKYLYAYPEECENDIRTLLRSVHQASQSRFVAAYDYEVVYALRDKAPLVFSH